MMLTPEQSRLLAYLKVRQAAGNVGPTVSEMAAHMGLKGRGRIQELLVVGLQARGCIRRLPHKARAIEVLEPGQARTPLSEYSDDEIKAEYARRAWRFIGDPRIGVSGGRHP